VAKRKPSPALVEQLKKAIRESGRSLNDLGKSAGIDHSQLSRFMRAERDLSVTAAGRLCDVLGLKLAHVSEAADRGKGK
jgi:hypothetical protein